ncbi:MAG: hypothetical protein U1D30_05260 [Planctomycetota bacterium]
MGTFSPVDIQLARRKNSHQHSTNFCNDNMGYHVYFSIKELGGEVLC